MINAGVINGGVINGDGVLASGISADFAELLSAVAALETPPLTEIYVSYPEALQAVAQHANAFSGGRAGAYSEGVGVSLSDDLKYSVVTHDSLRVLASLSPEGHFVFYLADVLRVRDSSSLAYLADYVQTLNILQGDELTRETALAFAESLVTQGAAVNTLHAMFALASSLVAATKLTIGFNVSFDDSAAVSGDSVLARETAFAEALVATAQVTTVARASFILSESPAFADLIRYGFPVGFSDTESINGELFPVTATSFVENLIASDLLDAALHGRMALPEVLALSGQTELGIAANIAESLGISPAQVFDVNMILNALESLVLGDTAALTASFLISPSEDFQVSDSVSSTAALRIALEEGIFIGGVINTPEGVFEAWVVNAETKAPWQYDNFPFNSFAFAGGKYLALTDSGLYELAGTTDDTETINWVIRTGLENFQSNQKKSVPWAYLGYTSSGRILFKTITTATGQKIENWYELEARTAEAGTETRVNIGRGLRSVYWQFELTNIDAAEFEFDDIQLMPVRLKRRL